MTQSFTKPPEKAKKPDDMSKAAKSGLAVDSIEGKTQNAKVQVPMRQRGLSDTYLDDETLHEDFTTMTFGTMSFRSPIAADAENERWTAEQMGLNTCILGSKIAYLVVLLALLIVAIVHGSSSLSWTFAILLAIDVIVLALSIGHAIRSHLGVLLALIGVESLIAIAGIVFAIVVMWVDNGRDCEQTHCGTLNLTSQERFFFFWILLGKGMLELFLCLMIVAMSPIIHDRNADDWPAHHPSHFGHDHDNKDWAQFLSPSGGSGGSSSTGGGGSKRATKLNRAFDEDSA